MDEAQVVTSSPSAASSKQFYIVANSVARLVETARQDLERDQEAAKASLVTASRLLQVEVQRCLAGADSANGGLAPWQMNRVRDYIDGNLHRTIHIRDLCAIARQSQAHFARNFKRAFGEPPHAHVMRRRLEKACHLMMTSTDTMSEIALSAGFSDQAHLCRTFKLTFGQSPASWRRARAPLGDLASTIDLAVGRTRRPLKLRRIKLAR